MPTFLKILSKSDIKTFDFPPVFNIEERKYFFSLPNWVGGWIERLWPATNKVGFMLQLGYFLATNRFFVASKFNPKDIEFICRKLEIDSVDMRSYVKRTFERHQEIILKQYGVKKFDSKCKNILLNEAVSLSSNQMKPRLMFFSLVDFLRKKKIEVPTYNTFADIITEAFKQFEKCLVALINKHLDKKVRTLLDDLLTIDDEYLNKKQDSKIKRYKITLLKTFTQSLRPLKIKENVNDLKVFKSLFKKVFPIAEKLQLSPEAIRYYAQLTIKSQVFQISNRADNRYLLLIAFVIHQYYRVNDNLVEALIQATQSAKNAAGKNHKDQVYSSRISHHKTNRDLYQTAGNHLSTLDDIRTIIQNRKLNDSEKVKAIKKLLKAPLPSSCTEIRKQLLSLENESTRIINRDDYYDMLESRSISLQKRTSDIVKNIEFDGSTSNPKLFEAITYYKRKDGKLDGDTPIDFIKKDEQKILFNKKGKIRTSLYKILLFQYIANSVKSGALNLCYSYRYRAFNGYLIPKDEWESNKKKLLDRAGLTDFVDFQKLQSKLAKALKTQYCKTNDNINNKKNKHARFDPGNNLKVATPGVDKTPVGTIGELFPKKRLVPLFEVLSTVNKITDFTNCFEHWQIKYNQNKPHARTFFAGAIAYGCNHGIRKIAKISSNIDHNELESTVNWYFSRDNLNDANDKILQLTDRLQLANIYNRKDGLIHTSSDGKKYTVGVDALNARYSYKYTGQNMGVTSYTFTDHRNLLFYSTVMSPTEREAPYVFDGLMHNDVVKSNIHSTDTHGYSEIIFGVAHLLGISFAPRIKNFKKQRLYSFEKTSEFKTLGYQILPSGRINTNLIAEYWDDILRFVATIKLKVETASQLFRRLSSYSRQNPLYKALKHFGRIIKSLFLLRYIDSLELRQAIEKQLNKIESINKFDGAVFNANNQEIMQGTREEQLITEGCKRLIENSIICWNYLFLSQLLYNTEMEEKRKTMVDIIRNGSVVTWQHINLHGEFDFSDRSLKNSYEFKLSEIFEVEIT